MWRSAVEREEWQPEQWEQVEDVRGAATGAVRRGGDKRVLTDEAVGDSGSARTSRGPRPPAEVVDELTRVVGPTTAPKLGQRLAEATRAYDRERFNDARKLLRPLADRAPGSAAVRELYGLTLYRMGKWREASAELEAFRTLTGSTDQHPVLADCARALRHWDRVEELWAELRDVSPSAALVAEGRIVAAGALADKGNLEEAIRLLEAGVKGAKRLQDHHLRLFYALADLKERAGDVPGARTLFNRVSAAEPDFADVAVRLKHLG